MILTVTPNTGIDYTLIVPEFRLDATLRARETAWGMGAKATDVSWILGRWGVSSLALGFAAGDTGRHMEAMLQARGVQTDFVPVEGETRLNVVVVCAATGRQSTLTANTLRVRADHVQALRDRYAQALPQASCVVLGGSLPDGAPLSLYPDLIEEARARGIPVIFDSSGPALRDGLAARPTLIKPNQAELAELTGHATHTLADTYRLAAALQRETGVDLIVTLGGAGALALLGARHYHIPPLRVKAVSTAGAGDGVLAGMALALSRSQSAEEGLRLGFALAGAVVMTPATADFRPEDAQQLLAQVELIPWPADHRTGR
ncbi:MAG: 1-phosphofructokinase family hexose kinase [Anaerolineae bacterium]|nr:1-phosphofructokinase family hexose kinase [Thermoflexales bacterium]MDW8407224.1 1-phosphofructokinase family hexose kinase [Anaerolineae bacterium]